MAQLITAQFIKSNGFATGLVPSLVITNMATNGVDSVIMTEKNAGNYYYEFNDYNPDVDYLFKFDALDATVTNRYQGGSSDTIKIIGAQFRGGYAQNEHTVTKETLSELKKDLLDYMEKKLGDMLGEFVQIIPQSDVQFDYGTILHSIEENTKLVVKSVDNIKIPKYDDKIVKELIKKSITTTKDKSFIDGMKKDILIMKGNIDKIKTNILNPIEGDDTFKKLLELLKPLEKNDTFKKLLKLSQPLDADEDFIKLLNG